MQPKVSALTTAQPSANEGTDRPDVPGSEALDRNEQPPTTNASVGTHIAAMHQRFLQQYPHFWEDIEDELRLRYHSE